MTSYEIVRRSVEFDKPERIALRFASLGLNDTWEVPLQGPAGWTPPAPQVDEWGCVWHLPDPESGVQNMGQPKGHPLVSLDRLEEFPWPDPTDGNRYAALEEALSQAGDRYVMAGLGFVLFERMYYLYGMDKLFVAMYERPEQVHELAERVLDFALGVVRELGRRFPGRIHGFYMSDDWGTQRSSFIQIPMWREFFRERYRRLFEALHQAGMHAWMHSCGHINEVIEEWIGCGLDVVNPQQPRNLGIEEIGQRYRGRICFDSLCDIQHTLPWASTEEIQAEARLLLEQWATPQGGFVLGDYGDGRAIGVGDDKKRVMLQAFLDLAAPGLRIPEPGWTT